MHKTGFFHGLVGCLAGLAAFAAHAGDTTNRGYRLLSGVKPASYHTGKLADGAPVYVDRRVVYTAVPTKYFGLDYLMTAEAHATESGAGQIAIATNRATTVYVGYDASMAERPAWLRGWQATGDRWKTSAATLSVVSREFDAGSISLGGNGTKNHHMYTVALRAAPTGSSAPQVYNDTAMTAAGMPIFIAALANDRGLVDQPVHVEVITNPDNGTAMATSRLGLLYEPAAGFIGTDGFLYRVTDADGDFDTGVVTITVAQPTGDQPVANNDFAALPEGTATTVNVLSNDSGLTDDPIVVSVAAQPANGVAVVTADTRVRYVPAAGFVGIDSLRYQVSDGDGGSDEATLHVLVYPVNDAQPSAEDDQGAVAAGSAVAIAVLDNDAGLDDAPIMLDIAQPPANGGAQIVAEEFVAYTPNSGFTGSDALTYRITDADGDQSEAQLILMVFQPNRPPTIAGTAPTSVVAGNGYFFAPIATDPDTDDVLVFSIANKPGWASFDSASGELSGTPGSGDVGTTKGVVISVTDGAQSASLDAFDITVVEVTLGTVTLNWDPPLFNEDGSPVDDLASYRVYLGQDAGSLSLEDTVAEPGATSFVVDNLVPGTYWLAVSAVDLAGNESVLSDPVSKTIEQQ